MKIIMFLLALSASLALPAHAGLYLDIGGGWIREVTIEETRTQMRFTLPLDSTYLVFRGGFAHKNWHAEFEVIGNESRSFKTIKVYRRWEFFK